MTLIHFYTSSQWNCWKQADINVHNWLHCRLTWLPSFGPTEVWSKSVQKQKSNNKNRTTKNTILIALYSYCRHMIQINTHNMTLVILIYILYISNKPGHRSLINILSKLFLIISCFSLSDWNNIFRRITNYEACYPSFFFLSFFFALQSIENWVVIVYQRFPRRVKYLNQWCQPNSTNLLWTANWTTL